MNSADNSTTPKSRICVIADTNIWRSNLQLRTPLGAALIYCLRRANAKLGLLEVIEEEITKHIVKAGTDAKSHISSGLLNLARVTGTQIQVELPSHDELTTAVASRFDDLADIIVRTEFTIKHARSALTRVNLEIPPKQFKDSAIWEAVLDLAESFEVHFISDDAGFFETKDKLKMHPQLRVDAQGKSIFIHSNLQSCIDSMRPEVPRIAKDDVIRALIPNLQVLVELDAADKEFEVKGVEDSQISLSYTERSERISTKFSVTYKLADVSGEETPLRSNATLTYDGTCYFNPSDNSVSDTAIDGESLDWKDEFGELKRDKFVYMKGSSSVSRRPNSSPLHVVASYAEEPST